jgi:hypothetical protein
LTHATIVQPCPTPDFDSLILVTINSAPLTLPHNAAPDQRRAPNKLSLDTRGIARISAPYPSAR